jgi:hypothetical protein
MRLSKGQGGSEAHGKSARTRERAHEKARARARAREGRGSVCEHMDCVVVRSCDAVVEAANRVHVWDVHAHTHARAQQCRWVGGCAVG